MKAETWVALLSAAVAAVALFHTLWNGRRTSEASLRAINADNRAEEALGIAKALEERDRQRFENEKATMDAPQIADRWVSEIQFQWSMHHGQEAYDLSKEVKTPAERNAVEILRANKDSLHLIAINYNPEKQSCTISGWNAVGYKRRWREVGRPPKLGGAS